MKLKATIALCGALLVSTSHQAIGQENTDKCGRLVVDKVEQPNTRWEPDAAGRQIPIWPDDAPVQPPEMYGQTGEMVGTGSPLIAGKPWSFATFVTQPTITVYAPPGENNGAALLVLPGGGYAAVAMDLEGTEVCDWITQHGVTCAVLKYRTPYLWQRAENGVQVPPDGPPLPLQDAQRAMSLIRHDAASFGIDPDRIGTIGFSSGAHLAAQLSNWTERSYEAIDAIDNHDSLPNFSIIMYPGRFLPAERDDHEIVLAPWMQISASAPPTLVVHAMDDPTNDPRHAMAYALALDEVGVPVDLQIFAKGCHAFGLRATADPVTRHWPEFAAQWLRDLDMIR